MGTPSSSRSLRKLKSRRLEDEYQDDANITRLNPLKQPAEKQSPLPTMPWLTRPNVHEHRLDRPGELQMKPSVGFSPVKTATRQETVYQPREQGHQDAVRKFKGRAPAAYSRNNSDTGGLDYCKDLLGDKQDLLGDKQKEQRETGSSDSTSSTDSALENSTELCNLESLKEEELRKTGTVRQIETGSFQDRLPTEIRGGLKHNPLQFVSGVKTKTDEKYYSALAMDDEQPSTNPRVPEYERHDAASNPDNIKNRSADFGRSEGLDQIHFGEHLIWTESRRLTVAGDGAQTYNGNQLASHDNSSSSPNRDMKSSPKLKRSKRKSTIEQSRGDDHEAIESTSGRSKRVRTTTKSYKEVSETFKEPIAKTSNFETFYGFIENEMDALLVVQGTIHGVLKAFKGDADDMASVKVRSGTVIVMPENGTSVKRWRDGLRWSPSRAYGPFILYRQIESVDSSSNASVLSSDNAHSEVSPHSVTVHGLEPTYSTKTLKEGTQIAKTGLTKRTITIPGSDGQKHRVVSYYSSADVLAMTSRREQAKNHHMLPSLTSSGTGGSSSSSVSNAVPNARDGVAFMRAVDSSELTTAAAEHDFDLAAHLKQLFPDWKADDSSPLRRYSMARSERLAGVRQGGGGRRKQRNNIFSGDGRASNQHLSVLYSDFEGYYPYEDDAPTYDGFYSSRVTRASQQPQDPTNQSSIKIEQLPVFHQSVPVSRLSSNSANVYPLLLPSTTTLLRAP
ncbi:Gti1/Pac2 family-domain-containing protein [Obelidium mucronatum]|nr:Gti1/Pac2 family-domain-containing protein [Obelidium mucronatum]